MRVRDVDALKLAPETRRRNETVRNEVIERHLLDTEADEEKPLCGEEDFDSELIAVPYYLEDRLRDLPVGAVCEGCKVQAVPLALKISRDLEAEGMLDEAEEFRRLAEALVKETGQDRSGPLGNNA